MVFILANGRTLVTEGLVKSNEEVRTAVFFPTKNIS